MTKRTKRETTTSIVRVDKTALARLAALKIQIDATTKEIGRKRDELRALISDAEDIAESIDRGIEEVERGLEQMSRGVDSMSELV